MSFLRHYLIALSFFTRVPVTGTLAQWVGSTPDRLRASAGHLPGVGWLVGIVACAAFALLGLALPETDLTALAAAVGSTIATALLTGGSHERGLLHVADDLADGTAPRRVAEPTIEEPRRGAVGAVVVVLALFAKITLLAVLAARSPVAVLAALLAGHVVSRFCPLVLVRFMPCVVLEGTAASPPVERIETRDLLVGAAWTAAALLVGVFAQGIGFVTGSLLATGLALLWMRRLCARRFQGFTGHGLGATQQVCEIAFYAGAAVALGLE